jgi:hypothetical protein
MSIANQKLAYRYRFFPSFNLSHLGNSKCGVDAWNSDIADIAYLYFLKVLHLEANVPESETVKQGEEYSNVLAEREGPR